MGAPTRRTHTKYLNGIAPTGVQIELWTRTLLIHSEEGPALGKAVPESL